MAREKTFNLIPEAQLREKLIRERFPAVTITKNGHMRFNSASIEEYGLEGRYIRLYADPAKKALAWHLFDEGNGLSELNLKHLKRDSAKNVIVSVGRVLQKMGLKIEESVKDLPIEKYEDLMEKKTFFYVIVREKNVKKVEEEPSILE